MVASITPLQNTLHNTAPHYTTLQHAICFSTPQHSSTPALTLRDTDLNKEVDRPFSAAATCCPRPEVGEEKGEDESEEEPHPLQHVAACTCVVFAKVSSKFTS